MAGCRDIGLAGAVLHVMVASWAKLTSCGAGFVLEDPSMHSKVGVLDSDYL
jgi:hypothetical protein